MGATERACERARSVGKQALAHRRHIRHVEQLAKDVDAGVLEDLLDERRRCRALGRLREQQEGLQLEIIVRGRGHIGVRHPAPRGQARKQSRYVT